jgi:hypothetical protein
MNARFFCVHFLSAQGHVILVSTNFIECFLELDQKYVQLVCLVLFCYLYARVLSAALGLLFHSSDSMLHIDAENVVGTLFEHQFPVWCSTLRDVVYVIQYLGCFGF